MADQATLKPHKNTIREGMEQALGDFYRTLGYSDNYSRGVGASNLLENTTGLGAFTSGQDAATSAGQGDWTGAAGNLAMAGLAAMPGGSEARAGVKKVAEEVAAPALRDELAAVVRPPQEKSGIFDYGVKNAPYDAGVQRFVPKKVPERTQDLMNNPEVYDKFMQGMERGLPVKDWYETGPLEKSFTEEFGADTGRDRFNQFIDAVAATSPRSDVGTNVRNASYYYGKAQPFPGRNSVPSISDLPPKNPKPYGHLAQNLHRMNAEKMVFPGGAGLDFKANAKPISFAANLKGDPNPVTVDTHAFRAPNILSGDPRFLERSFMNEKGATPRNIQDELAMGELTMEDAQKRGALWASKPLPTEYAAYEDLYRRGANDLGITPREAQAASWVGHGPMTGLESAPKSFMDFMEERILKTARERNMDPKDVWKKAVRGSMPLLGGAGAGVGLGASILAQPDNTKQEY